VHIFESYRFGAKSVDLDGMEVLGLTYGKTDKSYRFDAEKQ